MATIRVSLQKSLLCCHVMPSQVHNDYKTRRGRVEKARILKSAMRDSKSNHDLGTSSMSMLSLHGTGGHS